jgi:lipopolysaccharide/colanic/teichoic acid biosynthesis glycosyltransferase
MAKRAADILASLMALAVLAVPMLLIALAIRLESRGPAIFRQRRAGYRGQSFTMLKFRTMRTDADPYGMSPASGRDPRLTRVGRFLRETSLDELPQLLNILAGQMSLVGPRPLYERQAAQWDAEQRRRLDVKPGLTGYAQAYGRASLPIEDKIEMDLHYVDNRGWLMDLRIVFRTVANMFGSDKDVYEKQYSRDRRRERDDQEESGDG